ncbi:MAG TPA: hypothetical protein VGN97_06250 [Mesorhizobium sp.]|jgi:uncharacterized protein HemX|nr:hypothetical protein [Mesorhizobium sp.]
MREAANDLSALARAGDPDAAGLALEIRRTAQRIDALRRRLMSGT